MLSKKEIVIPEKLINLAKKSSLLPSAIICADHEESIISAKKAYELKLIHPIFIGKKDSILDLAKKCSWKIDSFEIYDSNNNYESASIGAELAKNNKIKILIKGNIHTDELMKVYLKKDYGLIHGTRLSHIWHMTINKDDKPLFITDGALNVSPRLDVKLHILKNVVGFAKKIGIEKPRVAILSGTEDPIESMPSSMEAKELMDKSIKENIEAFVHGPLAFDNAISGEAARLKKINNEVAGNADVLLVPNLETGNSLSKIMVYFMGACAAGFIVGGKVPIVITSRADNVASRVASIAAAIIATQ